jgi:hypothetical protein
VVHQTRTVALSLLVGTLVLAAGCSGLIGNGDTTTELKLVNQDNTDHAVVVEISNETGLVYSDGRTVEAESDLNLEQFDGTGEFEVRVAVDGDRSERTHTFESDDNSIQVTNVGIDNEGVVTVE